MLEQLGEVNMRSLEEVLNDLNNAEKEFKEKCDKYGIEEKTKKKVKEVTEEVKEVADKVSEEATDIASKVKEEIKEVEEKISE